MSGIIKSGNHSELSSVRPIGVPVSSVLTLPRVDEERERLRRAVASLESEVRQRDTAIEALRKDVERAFTDGMAKGREAGLLAAEDRQSERLALLEKAACDAQAEISNGLTALERLSALLARECVDIILGDADNRAELIGIIVAAQVEKIDKAMLLGIEVSRQDFPDDDALGFLAARLGPLSVAVTASTDMPSGACVMSLRLGRMSVGIDQQWRSLGEVLGVMALPKEAP